MTTQQVRVDGVDIAYTDTGSGPTILFVHGVYVTGALWNDVVSELDGGFRCVVPTWPLGAHSTPTGGADIGAEPTAQCQRSVRTPDWRTGVLRLRGHEISGPADSFGVPARGG